MSAIAGVVVVAVIGGLLVIMLGWVQAVRTRRATREGLERAEGAATDEALLGLVHNPAPDSRVRGVTSSIHSDEELADDVNRLRAEDQSGS